MQNLNPSTVENLLLATVWLREYVLYESVYSCSFVEGSAWRVVSTFIFVLLGSIVLFSDYIGYHGPFLAKNSDENTKVDQIQSTTGVGAGTILIPYTFLSLICSSTSSISNSSSYENFLFACTLGMSLLPFYKFLVHLSIKFALKVQPRFANLEIYAVELLSLLGTCVTLSCPLCNIHDSTQYYVWAIHIAIAMTVFNLVSTFIMTNLYKSFSIGETMIVGQIFTLFVVDFLHFMYAKQRHALYFILGIPSNSTGALAFTPVPSVRNETMIFVQYIIACTLWVGATTSAATSYFAKHLDRRQAVTIFYSLLVVQFSAWVYFSKFVFHEEGVNVITWLIYFVFVEASEPLQFKRTNIFIICYWLTILIVGIYIVSKHGEYLSNNIKIIKRKFFHILAVLLFVPVAYVNIELLNVALGVALGIFILVEFIRLNDTYSPIGLEIEKYLKEHTDERDDGQVILTHMYLLVGCAIPLWIGSMTLFHYDTKQLNNAPTDTGVIYLCLLSGITSVGIGDAMGSVVGKLCDKRNKIKWLNTNKSVQGTVGMATSIFFSNTFLYLYSNIIFATVESGGKTTGSHRYDIYEKKNVVEIVFPLMYVSVAVSLLEACTLQIDNLVLPLFLYSLTRLTRW